MDTRTICLAVLSRGDASGYEIKKTLGEAPFSQIQEVGFGSIYPALNKLQEEGLAAVTETPQEGRPDKKVYSITASGRMALVDALGQPSDPDRVRSDFLFRTLFADLMSARDLDQLIEQRLFFIRAAIARMEGCISNGRPNPGEAFVTGFGLALYRTMEAYIEDNRSELVSASLLAETAVAE